MAQQISLADFDFNTDKLIKSLTEIKTALQAQTRELNVFKKSLKDNQDTLTAYEKENNKLQKSMAKLKAENKENTIQYRDLERALETNEEETKKLKVQEEQLTQTIISLEPKLASLKTEYKLTSDVLKSVTLSTGEFSSATDKATQALGREITSKNSARANNRELLDIMNELNPAIQEEADLLFLLNQRYDENQNFIKQSSSAYEKQKINIGNYSESIQDAAGNLDIFSRQGLTNFIAKSQEAGGAGNLVTGSLKQMTAGIVGITKASLAFIATPVGAVLAAIAIAVGLVANAMNRSEETTNKFNRALAPLTGMFNKLLEALEPVGDFLVNAFVVYLDLAERQLYAMVEALARVSEYLGFDESAASIRGFGLELQESAEASRELADAEAELERSQRRARLTQLDYQKDAEKFRQIRDDENRSIKDRMTANEQLGAVLKKQMNEELEIANKALNAVRLRAKEEGLIFEDVLKAIKTGQSIVGASTKLLDDTALAMTNVADIQERITGQESEQLTNRVQLQKEAEQKAQQIRDEAERKREEAFRRELQRMNEELDLWIANQGIRARSLQEELDFQRKIAEDSIRILDYELKNKKISRDKYAAEVKKIENELALSTINLAVENAAQELELWNQSNKSKLDSSRRLTADLVLEEKRRLNEEYKLQQQALQLKNLNDREYLIESQRLDAEFKTKQKEIDTSYAEQNRQEELTMQALQYEEDILLMQERRAKQWEIEQEQRDQQFQTQLEALDTQREQNKISEEEYQQALSNIELKWNIETNKAKKDLEKEQFETRLGYAQRGLDMLGELAGKDTAAAKAVGVAKVGIDTAMAIMKSYSDLGPIGGTIFAAIVGTLGALSIRKIIQTKEPKVNTRLQGFSTSGVVSGGVEIRRSNGDNRLITAKDGEVVLNEHHQKLAGGAPFFAALGVPGFATSGIVGGSQMLPSQSSFVQNQVTNQINMDAIREAVRDGAMEGSLEGSLNGSRQGSAEGANTGIRDLSTDREILKNAAF